jgi:hypothetical protein
MAATYKQLVIELQQELEATQKALNIQRITAKNDRREKERLFNLVTLVGRELAEKRADYYEWAVEDCPRTLSEIHKILLGEDE